MCRTIIILLIAFLLASCKAERSEPAAVAMSDRFDLCVRLPKQARYQILTRGMDFDVGHLVIGGTLIEVYIGQQPSFSGNVWPRSSEVTKDFFFIGKEREEESEKILLGHKRYARRGPLFVMFKGSDLSSVEPILREKGFVADCRVKGASAEKWREEPAIP